MNFLSHYYFESNNNDPYMVTGTVLPDLVKNANKHWNLYPQKNEALFSGDNQLTSILQGWKRHLAVDLLFHSSDFFQEQTAVLKQLLLPILNGSPVRPSFLSHIGVELMLDHLLVIHRQVDVNAFYNKLNLAENKVLEIFLQKSACPATTDFFIFLDRFKSSRYLFSYENLNQVSYALQQICRRIWPTPFSEETVQLLNLQMEAYKIVLEKDYLAIYQEISAGLQRI